MSPSFDIWKLLTGVAFFLLSMNFLEDTLRQLAGRRFKLFLKKHTTNKLKAIGAGTIVTGVLQSSSIVNLLVLSMVGASVVKMDNALAIMLGSNLGTTIDSWLVATLGFNFYIDEYAMAIGGITGITMTFIKAETKLFYWFKFLFSLAFLFIALKFIKTGMEGFVKQTDLTVFNEYPVIVFLLVGFFLTSIIQSSSATIAITLSALYTGAITLYTATAIVLGSEVGTTLKLFLAAAKGLAEKKRVALGNFLFNAITVTFVFLILSPVNLFITNVIQIKDNLIALVFFQSFVNLFAIILFFPFLSLFGNFLLKRYDNKEDEMAFINKVTTADYEIALDALQNEVGVFINQVIDYGFDSFGAEDCMKTNSTLTKNFSRKTIMEKYQQLKKSHGEIHAFYIKLQSAETNSSDTERLDQLISALRNAMYAAKNIKDAQHDIKQVRNSSNDTKYNFYIFSREKLIGFYQQVLELLNHEMEMNIFNRLTSLYKGITTDYSDTLKMLYNEKISQRVNEEEISTLINFNRELYTSYKSIVFALKDYLLKVKEAKYFDALPGFIR